MSNDNYITIHLYELLYILFVFGHSDDLSLFASILRGRLQSFVDVLARSFFEPLLTLPLFKLVYIQN